MSVKYIGMVLELPADLVSCGERMVLVVLADHANAEGRCWPGIPSIARKAGMSERSVQRHIRRLETMTPPLVVSEARRGPKGETIEGVFRLCLPHTTDGGAGDNLSPGPVSTCHRAGDRRAGGPVTNPARPYKEEPTTEPSNNTPHPPTGGVGAAETDGTTAESFGPAEAEAAVARAYAEVHDGEGLPLKWRRAVRREARGGASAMIARVTAADIRGARALAGQRQRTFGFGWLVKYLEGQAASRKARREADERERQRRQAEAEERRRQADEAEARKRHWDGLSDAERERYRDEARRKYGGSAAAVFMIGTPQRLDSAAEQLAWQEHKAGGPREAVA